MTIFTQLKGWLICDKLWEKAPISAQYQFITKDMTRVPSFGLPQIFVELISSVHQLHIQCESIKMRIESSASLKGPLDT